MARCKFVKLKKFSVVKLVNYTINISLKHLFWRSEEGNYFLSLLILGIYKMFDFEMGLKGVKREVKYERIVKWKDI